MPWHKNQKKKALILVFFWGGLGWFLCMCSGLAAFRVILSTIAMITKNLMPVQGIGLINKRNIARVFGSLFRHGDGGLNSAGSSGYYWSRSLNTDDPYNAWGLNFTAVSCRRQYCSSRGNGFTVRPVRQK